MLLAAAAGTLSGCAIDDAAPPPGGPHGPLATMAGVALWSLVSEDLALITGGVLAADGRLSLAQAIAAGFAGILGGDLLLYAGGRWLGGSVLRRMISAADLERGKRFFGRAGGLGALVGSRFVPGLRLPTYVAAGALGAPFGPVFGLLSLAALLWVPLVVGASMTAGREVLPRLHAAQVAVTPAALGVMGLAWAVRGLVLPSLSWQGRRRLVGRWRRWRHWEFWPMWAFYPPVILHVLALGLRHRSLTVFTLANPAMPAGGFVGESKDAIYRGLAAGAGDALLAYRRVDPGASPGQRAADVAAWMAEAGLAFPVVLKPDAGQRGQAVVIARSASDVADYFRAVALPVIAQEFAPGEEFGVFYARPPGAARGRVISITEKRPAWLVGDGHRTLGELILLDERAVCQAAMHERRQAGRLDWVPLPGERVPLVEIGTHRLGAEFLDAWHLHSAELEAAIDAIAAPYAGFHFGRFDLRAPSAEHLRRGRGLKVVELNGVTAEPTHIYDRRHSVWRAWRDLRAQWRLAFAIGHAHRRRGLRPTGVLELFRQVRDFQSAE